MPDSRIVQTRPLFPSAGVENRAPGASVFYRFEAQSELAPHAVALSWANGELTCAELRGRAEHVAAVDLLARAPDAREEEAARVVARETRHPFELDRLPLVRWTLLRMEDDRWRLVHVEHHLIHDGWSFQRFLDELLALYTAFAAGRPSPPEPLPLQFADWAHWQRAQAAPPPRTGSPGARSSRSAAWLGSARDRPKDRACTTLQPRRPGSAPSATGMERRPGLGRDLDRNG
jgi:hypothetical protein